MPFCFYVLSAAEIREFSRFFSFLRNRFVRGVRYICNQDPEEAPMKSELRNSINHEKISALAEILADKLIEEIRKRALEKRENFPKEAA